MSGVKEHEYLAYISCWGSIIIAAETLAMELREVQRIHTWPQILSLLGFAVTSLLFYTSTPPFIKRFGATMFNMSLVPTMVYSLVFALLVYSSQLDWLYFGGYAAVILGLSLYCLTDKFVKAHNSLIQPDPPLLEKELTS